MDERFPRSAAAFFRDLRSHNDRSWWLANKDRFERVVAAPVAALVADLEREFGPIHRFRPYRDVRFSPDKRPYQEHTSFAVDRPGGVLYAQLGADDLLVAGGRWQPSPAELSAFRRLVDDPRSAEAVEAALDEMSDAGLHPDDEAVLRTAPRGYPRDHPRIDLLRRTRLSVRATVDVDELDGTAEVAEVIGRLWRSADRWNAWLHHNVPALPDGLEGRSRRHD